jgi:hypothetical protein
MKAKEFVEQINENLDRHAAVLMAHTKDNEDQSKSVHKGKYQEKIPKLAKDVKYLGSKLDHEYLKDKLSHYGLKLKSSHPDALKNLHSNLMKVK